MLRPLQVGPTGNPVQTTAVHIPQRNILKSLGDQNNFEGERVNVKRLLQQCPQWLDLDEALNNFEGERVNVKWLLQQCPQWLDLDEAFLMMTCITYLKESIMILMHELLMQIIDYTL